MHGTKYTTLVKLMHPLPIQVNVIMIVCEGMPLLHVWHSS